MKHNKIVLIILIVLVSLGLNLYGSENAGTTGFNFLRVTYSARAAGLANTFTGIADDADAVFYNPAGFPQIAGKSFSTSYINYFEGFQGGAAAYVFPHGENMFYGAFVQYLGNQDIPKTLVDEQGNYLGTSGTFGANNIVFGFSGSRFIHEMLNIGASVKFIYEGIDEYSASAVAFDAGLLHHTTNENLKVGVTLKNIGKQLTYHTSTKYEEDLPTTFTIGFHYFPQEKFNAALDINKPLDHKFSVRLGVEYRIHEYLALRSGYNSRSQDWKAGGDYEALSGLSFGTGFFWRDYILDYAISSYGDLGFVNQISLKYHF